MLQPDKDIDLKSSVCEVEEKILDAKTAETQRKVNAAIKSTLEGIERMEREVADAHDQKARLLEQLEKDKKDVAEHYAGILTDLGAELTFRQARLEAIRKGNWEALSPDFGRPASELHKIHDGGVVSEYATMTGFYCSDVEIANRIRDWTRNGPSAFSRWRHC